MKTFFSRKIKKLYVSEIQRLKNWKLKVGKRVRKKYWSFLKQEMKLENNKNNKKPNKPLIKIEAVVL